MIRDFQTNDRVIVNYHIAIVVVVAKDSVCVSVGDELKVIHKDALRGMQRPVDFPYGAPKKDQPVVVDANSSSATVWPADSKEGVAIRAKNWCENNNIKLPMSLCRHHKEIATFRDIMDVAHGTRYRGKGFVPGLDQATAKYILAEDARLVPAVEARILSKRLRDIRAARSAPAASVERAVF